MSTGVLLLRLPQPSFIAFCRGLPFFLSAHSLAPHLRSPAGPHWSLTTAATSWSWSTRPGLVESRNLPSFPAMPLLQSPDMQAVGGG